MSKPIFMRRPTHDRTLDVWMSLIEERVPVISKVAISLDMCAFLVFGRSPVKAVIDTGPTDAREVNLGVKAGAFGPYFRHRKFWINVASY